MEKRQKNYNIKARFIVILLHLPSMGQLLSFLRIKELAWQGI